MKWKVSSIVGLLAWVSLLALPWFVLLVDIRPGDPKVGFAAGMWIVVGLVSSTISTGKK